LSIALDDSGPEGLPPADPMPPEIAALRDTEAAVWIFGYGSLIWQPEFQYAAAEPARLHGWHRSFCLYSYDYRGTRPQPGLTLGLDHGGSCRGIAFRLAPDSVAVSLDTIWRREMTAPRVYDLRPLNVRTAAGALRALAFTVRRGHPDYAGRLPLDERARIVARAAGSRGACRDYLANTLAHLERHGIVDRPLRRLAARIGLPLPELVRREDFDTNRAV
jgi:cation transport protein ChaC